MELLVFADLPLPSGWLSSHGMCDLRRYRQPLAINRCLHPFCNCLARRGCGISISDVATVVPFRRESSPRLGRRLPRNRFQILPRPRSLNSSAEGGGGGNGQTASQLPCVAGSMLPVSQLSSHRVSRVPKKFKQSPSALSLSSPSPSFSLSLSLSLSLPSYVSSLDPCLHLSISASRFLCVGRGHLDVFASSTDTVSFTACVWADAQMDIGAGTMVYPDSVLYAVLVFMMLIFAFVGYQGYKVGAQAAAHHPSLATADIRHSHKCLVISRTRHGESDSNCDLVCTGHGQDF
jgi:hypothetical protein